jgi:RNA polymerase sigma-70 factor (ECF subfamily)
MLGNDEEAQDICQEALVKAYQNIDRLRDPAKFSSWIHHIALNLCRDWHRSSKRRLDPQSYEEGEGRDLPIIEAKGGQVAADHEAERSSLSDVLRSVFVKLPMEQRTAILLREYQGFSSQEIAQIMGVPSATVRTRIYYGLKSARKMLLERGITEAYL